MSRKQSAKEANTKGSKGRQTSVRRSQPKNTLRATAGVSLSDGGSRGIFGLWDATRSGVIVDENTAMNFAAFYAAVSLISECCAILPRKVYRSSVDEGVESREEVRKHPAWKICNRTPDGIRSAYTLFETMTIHACTVGNAYAEIVRNGRGQAVECHILDPKAVSVLVDPQTGRPVYHVFENRVGTVLQKELTDYQVLHIKAPGWDGIIGKSPVTRARESIGLGLAAEIYGSRFFGKGGRPLGFLTKPNRISKKERDTIRQEWEELHGGLDNSLQVGVLHGGLDWKPIGLTNEDAQFLQTRKFQVTEIARWFRIPPHMLGDMEKASYANVEHMLIEFVTFTMLPWVRRWESELNMKLFTRDEQFTHYVEFQLDGLLRADSRSRAEALERQLRNGVLTPDEWRKLENRPVYPDGIGAEPLIMASQLCTLRQVAQGQSVLVDFPKISGTNTETTSSDMSQDNIQQDSSQQD